MKKILLKKCCKPVTEHQKEKASSIIGREMFNQKTPKVNIPMYCMKNGKVAK